MWVNLGFVALIILLLYLHWRALNKWQQEDPEGFNDWVD